MRKWITLFIVFLLLGLAVLAQSRFKPFVDKTVCTGCGDCVSNCPVQAIEMIDNKAVIDAEKCIDCKICVRTCPVTAIRPTR